MAEKNKPTETGTVPKEVIVAPVGEKTPTEPTKPIKAVKTEPTPSVGKVFANQYDKAVEKVANYDGITIPKEIKECDAVGFHVALIKSEANHVTSKFDFTAEYVIYDFKSWDKMQQGLISQLGYKDAVVYHRPL